MQKFKFEITQEQLNIIALGLGKLPMEQAFTTFQDLQKQAQGQMPVAATQEDQTKEGPELKAVPKAEVAPEA